MKITVLATLMIFMIQAGIRAEPFVPIGGNTDLSQLAEEINEEMDESRKGTTHSDSFITDAMKLFFNMQDKTNEFTENIVQLLYPFGDIESGYLKVDFQ